MTTAAARARRLHARWGERGVAALVVTLLLFFAMVLGVAFVNRSLVFEQRASANQYRSTQAFEAAEAGLEWALAQLAGSRPLDADCLDGADPAESSFRERYLPYDASTASHAPRTWDDAGVTKPLLPTCVRTRDGWACSCPTAAPPSLAAPAEAPAPAFNVSFQPTARAGIVRAVATGCTSLGGECYDGGAVVDASGRVQALFGFMPALHTAPAAAMTVRGAVDADTAPFGAHNRDASSGGLAIHAGGAVAASLARLEGPAGGATARVIAGLDPALATLTDAQFFARYFGLDRERWARQPSVHALACPSECRAALQAAIAADRGPTLIAVAGELRLEGPLSLGSAQRPVLIVADGNVELVGPVALTGLLYASGAVRWDGPAAGSLLRGALVAAGDYRGDATPELVYDPDVLAVLKGNAGTFVRVSGSWRDF
jgi:hypothetical protein